MTDILVEVAGSLGRVRLNRPKAINALTLEMIHGIGAALDRFADDPDVGAVLISGEGERGLCAGGDIRALYDHGRDGSGFGQRFFRDEYRMNAHIARFPKPYVALMDGIVMGGGIGVSAHGSHRVVTERSRLAMPETGIGFVPDIGGTFLLAHAPGELGMHAALSSFQMGADDAMICGLADHHVPSERLADLTAALLGCDSAPAIGACPRQFATKPPAGVFGEARGWIADCYAQESVEAILEALSARPEEAARQALAAIAGKSPTSLKITLRALREARHHERLEQSLEQEYRLAMACMERPDFREGVRAALVDKDRNPAWSPSRLEEVAPETIEAIFAASDHGGLGLLD